MEPDATSVTSIGFGQPLDIVYLFKHSRHDDEELRYSLRSVAINLPFIRKVWIFGDRPAFLADDKSIVEHVPHEYIAPLLGYRVPVRSDMLMLVLASLLPEVAHTFVRFSDDYIVLRRLTRGELCQPRALEDMNTHRERGGGKWKEQLWGTYDILKRFGYAGYNFESHTPAPLTKKLAFEAFMAFRPFLSEERYEGMLAATTIYNFAVRHHALKFAWLNHEHTRAGFYDSPPPPTVLRAGCRGKAFLNFNESAYCPALREYLTELFPKPCPYERDSRGVV